MKKWKLLSSKYLVQNNLFKLRADRCRMQNEKIADPYFIFEKNDYGIIAAFTPEGKIVLVEQYRHPVRSIDIELPAGFIEKKDKNPENSIRRELLEETGYKVKKIEKLGTFFASPGVLSNQGHFFIGYNAKKVGKQKLDEHENINVKIITPKKALEFVKKGKMKDLGSVLALHLALQKMGSKIQI